MREDLSALLEEGVLDDLKAGSNGAPKLSNDQLSQLLQFQELATPNRQDLAKGSFEKQVATSAEHLVNLVEKKVGLEFVSKHSFNILFICRPAQWLAPPIKSWLT